MYQGLSNVRIYVSNIFYTFIVIIYFLGNKNKVPLSKYVHLRKISFMNSSLASKNRSGYKESNEECTSSNTTNFSETTNCGKLEFSDILMELNNLTQTFLDLTCDTKT